MNNDAWLGLHNPFIQKIDKKHAMHKGVLPAFLRMQRAAADDGIDCQLVSSFRDFNRQAAIWNRKWRGELTLYDAHGTALNNDLLSEEQKLVAILTWSAMPGGSRHHWGTDIDVYDKISVDNAGGQFDLVDREYCEGGPCKQLADWLDEHASRFGFFRPFATFNGGVAREKWHLSYRDIAAEFEQARNEPALHQAIVNTDIAGKEALLHCLSAFYPRYVLNQGEPK